MHFGKIGQPVTFGKGKNTWSGEPGEISVFVDLVAQEPKVYRWLDLGPLAKVESDRLVRLGLDVAGFKHIIESHDVLHAVHRHSDPQIEMSRGQLALVPADFEQIPDVLAAPDSVEVLSQDARGIRAIRYEKQIVDGFVVIETVHVRRKSLAVRTMWKRRAVLNDTGHDSPPPDQASETFGAHASTMILPTDQP